ncbi:MAG: efflux RND transporter periplasmic adaptor subunit, partial [Chitinophagales bacterium]|nr:efflux RND transporter periplasmic adaptor subunit [Chitinophagales bacterium]
MKKLLIYTTAIILFASCGAKSAEEGADKQAQLEALRKERKDIDEKIKTLEIEIAKETGDSAEVKSELVIVTDVTTQPFVHYIELQGKVDAEENVTVTPQMPGTVQKIFVSEGQSVSKGQILAKLDNDAMQTSITTLQTQLTFAKDVFNKQKNLWDQKIGTEIQYLSAKTNVEGLENQIASMNEQLKLSNMVSPISGIVDAVEIKEGQVASPGFAGIRVVNMSSLKAKGEVSESHSAIVSTGDNTKIIIPDLNKEVDAKITFVSKVINTQSRTITAEAKLASDPILKPNMIIVMKIADYEAKEAIVIDLN